MSRPPDGESPRGGDLFGNSRSGRLTYRRYFLGRRGCYNSIMAIDPRQIELTAEQQQALAEMAEQAGRPWPDVLQDGLRSDSIVRSGRPIAQSWRSFYERVREAGADGVVKGGRAHGLAENCRGREGDGGAG